MRIAIIGAGNVGGTLGRGWIHRGHQVTYGVRDPDGAKFANLMRDGARVGLPRQAVEDSEVVVLATPWAATQEAVRALGDVGGRPLLDATNPIGPGFTMAVGHVGSGGEKVQEWAPTARVVKVFNTTGAENMATPRFGEQAATMFYCGDEENACAVAATLAADLGFDAVPAGPLRNARLLEPLGSCVEGRATPGVDDHCRTRSSVTMAGVRVPEEVGSVISQDRRHGRVGLPGAAPASGPRIRL